MTDLSRYSIVTCIICNSDNPRLGQSYAATVKESGGRKVEVTRSRGFYNIPLCDKCLKHISSIEQLDANTGPLVLGAVIFAVILFAVLLILEKVLPNLVTPNSSALVIRNIFCFIPIVLFAVAGIMFFIVNESRKGMISAIESSLNRYRIVCFMQNRANSPVTDEVRMAIADEVFKLRCLLEQKENQLTSQINLKMTKEVEQTKTDIKNLNSNIGLLDSLRKQN